MSSSPEENTRETESYFFVPCVQRNSGINQANNLFYLTKKWNIVEVVGIVFDTTASNTGKRTGTAAILERHFERKLMWLIFRQHIFELAVRHVGKNYLVPIQYHQILSSQQSRKIGWNSKKKTMTPSQLTENGCCFEENMWRKNSKIFLKVKTKQLSPEKNTGQLPSWQSSFLVVISEIIMSANLVLTINPDGWRASFITAKFGFSGDNWTSQLRTLRSVGAWISLSTFSMSSRCLKLL